ncbi:DUF2516 family protein [Cellulomonas citrea]|uniref:DUF2516 family protein n=1 Tax=Cellulomonas citrea TaxID=1909423 RepID=UPI00135AC763|nr:DUF2516 family protein [Cellulomonas citrea]
MIVTLQVLLFLLFYAAIVALCVWALVDCLRRPTGAFVSAGKRTKGLWTGVLAASAVVSFIAVPIPGGYSLGGGTFQFLALLAAVAAVVYLVDVRPAVQPYSRRKGPRGPRSGW